MIHKILSGGQTGVQRAALDTAIKLGISYGGWIRRGRRSEDGPLDGRYQLQETETVGVQEAIAHNVDAAEGTLIISRGTLSDWLTYSVQTTLQKHKQLLHADLSQHSLFEAATLICDWAEVHRIRSVYITGPLQSEDDAIYSNSCSVLEASVYLGFIKSTSFGSFRGGESAGAVEGQPVTVEQAVERLQAALSLKDRVAVANTGADQLDTVYRWLAEYIKKAFGLYAGNPELLQACGAYAGLSDTLPDEACMVIIRALWEELRRTHRMRLV